MDPTFVADLPHLQGLVVSDVTDLQPLIGTAITSFLQPWGGLADRAPLSLAPLAEIPELTLPAMRGRRLTDVAALQRHDKLSGLHLGELGSREALTELPRPPNLDELGIGGMPDLQDLEWLRFLSHPRVIVLTACTALDDVKALTQWEASLSWVYLDHCPAVDLRPLSTIRNLKSLSLMGSGSLDLTPVATLPRLRWLRLGYGPLPDVHPLKDTPSLALLQVRGVPEIDLEPLAGRERLNVQVDRSATVHGADRLGPGSRVVRQ